MTLQDRLAERSQPFLPESSPIRQVFQAQTGLNPLVVPLGAIALAICFMVLGTSLLGMWIAAIVGPCFLVFMAYTLFATKHRIVCVTDDEIYVLKAGMGGKPKELLATRSRQQRFGPVSGLWAKIDLTGDVHWVNKRFYKDIDAADATLGADPRGRRTS